MSESGVVGLAFLGTGALCLLIGGIFFTRTRRFLSWAVDAQGTVTDMVARSSSEGGTTYSPVVQFATQEGQQVTFTDLVGTNPPKHKAGDTVPVKYLPSDPQKARIPSWFRMWFVATLLGGMGALFFTIGAVLYLTKSDEPVTAASATDPAAVASGIPGLPGGIVPTPGIDVPNIPAAGSPILTITQGSNPPRLVTAACTSAEGTGKTRKVRLDVQGRTLAFTAKPFTGPGTYIPGQNLQAGGSLFGEEASISGAVIFDDTGKAGILNLTAGSLSVSGIWTCAGA